MLALVQDSPGITLAQLQRQLGLTNGVARHHATLLQATGAVRIVADGSLRRVWATEQPRVDVRPTLRDRVLATLRARGPMRAAQLAAELRVSRQALHYHVKRLERDGHIEARREQAELVLVPVAS